MARKSSRTVPHQPSIWEHSCSSLLAPRIHEYIAVNRAAGKSFNNQARVLAALDRYITAHPSLNDGTLGRECVAGFIAQYASGLHSTSQLHGVATYVRGLALYLLSVDVDAYVYPTGLLPRVTNRLPCIPTHEEVVAFMAHADSLVASVDPCWALGYRAYAVITRLLYCCGMRIGEPLGLAVGEVDTGTGRIDIIHSKGDKDRTVWVPAGLAGMLGRYDALVSPLFPGRRFFLVGNGGLGIHPGSFSGWFKREWRACFPDRAGGRVPSPHSLRHAMVIRRVDLWGGERSPEFASRLPALSRFLGHTCVRNTMLYYHQLQGHGQAMARAIGDGCGAAAEVRDAINH